MGLLSIIRAVWRHKLAIIPVIVLTVLGAFYILEIKPPVYEASSSLLFLNPQGPATKISTDNPYSNLGDVWTADAVVSAVAGDSPQAQVTLSTNPNNPPIIDISGTGPTPQAAIRVTDLATSQAMRELYQIQKRQGVNDLYMIRAVELVQPSHAEQTFSGKLRSLIAVLALGAILLFVTVSVAQAIEKGRRGGGINPSRSARARPWEATGPNGDGEWAGPAVGNRQPKHLSSLPSDANITVMLGPAELAQAIRSAVSVSGLPHQAAPELSEQAAPDPPLGTGSVATAQPSTFADPGLPQPANPQPGGRRIDWLYWAEVLGIMIVAAIVGSALVILLR
jgi:capsular polysaccharide biosynthesis protein